MLVSPWRRLSLSHVVYFLTLSLREKNILKSLRGRMDGQEDTLVGVGEGNLGDGGGDNKGKSNKDGGRGEEKKMDPLEAILLELKLGQRTGVPK